MDDTLSEKRYLLAWAITDGALDHYPEERRKEMIRSITKIYENLLQEGDPKRDQITLCMN